MRYRRPTVIALSALLAATLSPLAVPTSALANPTATLPAALAALEPNQVSGLTVTQADGFATVAWTPVEGATDYQIERTAGGRRRTPRPAPRRSSACGARTVRSTTSRRPSPTPGFNPGDRFQWRVRARIGTAEQPYSTPVFATTRAPWGDPTVPGQNLRTQWETTQRGAVHQRRRRVRLHRGDRRAERPGPGGRDRPHRAGPPDQHVRHRLPDPAGHPGGGGGDLAAGRQLQRARQRAGRPRGLPDHGSPAGLQQRRPDARPALAHHRADRPDDQRRRPGGQHPRQLDRAGPQPGLLADPPAGDRGVRADAARLPARWPATTATSTATARPATCRCCRRGTRTWHSRSSTSRST